MKKLILLTLALVGFAFSGSAQNVADNAIGLRMGDSDGFGADSDCFSPAISPNGRYITFSSSAGNLTGSNNEVNQVFLHDQEGNSRPVAETLNLSCDATAISCPISLVGQDTETCGQNFCEI